MEPLIFNRDNKTGWIEVICGSMFSGKTEELIRRLRRAQIARQKIEIFKPAVDTRYSQFAVVSHDDNIIPSTPVSTAAQILLLSGNADVIGIDEAQFFDHDLVTTCQHLARQGKRVIVVGLDQDYLGQPFEPIPQLMAVAEYVTKLHAVCVVCGAPANHSQRIVNDTSRLLIGAKDIYEPRCRRCFNPVQPDKATRHQEPAVDAPFTRVIRKAETERTSSTFPEVPDNARTVGKSDDK